MKSRKNGTKKNRQKDWTQKSEKSIGQKNRTKKIGQIYQTNNRTIYIGQKIGQKSDLKLD